METLGHGVGTGDHTNYVKTLITFLFCFVAPSQHFALSRELFINTYKKMCDGKQNCLVLSKTVQGL